MHMSRIQIQFLTIATILGLVYLKYRNYHIQDQQRTWYKEIDSQESKTSRIQQTAEFRRTFGERIESLTNRKAAARDPELIQLVREMMVPPFTVTKIRPNNASQINQLVLEVDNLLESKVNLKTGCIQFSLKSFLFDILIQESISKFNLQDSYTIRFM